MQCFGFYFIESSSELMRSILAKMPETFGLPTLPRPKSHVRLQIITKMRPLICT